MSKLSSIESNFSNGMTLVLEMKMVREPGYKPCMCFMIYCHKRNLKGTPIGVEYHSRLDEGKAMEAYCQRLKSGDIQSVSEPNTIEKVFTKL